MVYVGAPVNDAACVYSDGVTRPVYDKQRRWFSEVLKIFGAGANYFEIFAATGNNPADTLSATPTSGPIVVPGGDHQQRSSVASPATCVWSFRCKTNRGFADSDSRNSGYSSVGRGAVQVDDVTIDKGAGAGRDRRLRDAGAGWRERHRQPLPAAAGPDGDGRVALDRQAAGASTSTSRRCRTSRTTTSAVRRTRPPACATSAALVLTVGNHDDGENAGDSRFTAFREVSQTARVADDQPARPGAGGATPNSQGITASASRTPATTIILWYDMYAGMFNLSFSGESLGLRLAVLPVARMPNGGKCWGQLQLRRLHRVQPRAAVLHGLRGRSRDNVHAVHHLEPERHPRLAALSSWRTSSSASGSPSRSAATRTRVATSTTCRWRSSTCRACPARPAPAARSTSAAVVGDIWQFVNDTFPANETAGLPGTAAFDTTTGLIRTGLNTAQATGNALRFDIPGDSSNVIAANATVGTAGRSGAGAGPRGPRVPHPAGSRQLPDRGWPQHGPGRQRRLRRAAAGPDQPGGRRRFPATLRSGASTSPTRVTCRVGTHHGHPAAGTR